LHAKEAVCAASVQRWHSCLLASTRRVLRCVSHSIAPPLAPHATNLPAAAPPNSAPAGSAAHGHDSLQLPFELVALEAALKEVVNAAGMQVKELEALALPALDALTKSVSDVRQAAWQTVWRAVWQAGRRPLSAWLR
jgi:hypothetical protein